LNLLIHGTSVKSGERVLQLEDTILVFVDKRLEQIYCLSLFRSANFYT